MSNGQNKPSAPNSLNVEEPVEKVQADLFKALIQAPELAKFLTEQSKLAKEREKKIKGINQAKWFIKIKKGVSDTLKSKCLPLNKKTQDLIKQSQDGFKKLSVHIESCKKAFKTFEKAKKSSKERATAIEAILKGADHLAYWENFYLTQQPKIEQAVVEERKMLDVLDAYLKGKEAAKDLSQDEYKKFKKEQEELANSL